MVFVVDPEVETVVARSASELRTEIQLRNGKGIIEDVVPVRIGIGNPDADTDELTGGSP